MKRWFQYLAVCLCLLPLVVGAETITWNNPTTNVDGSTISAADRAKIIVYLRGWKDGIPGAKTYFGETRGGLSSWTDNILVRMNQWAASGNVSGWIVLKAGDNVLVTASAAMPYLDNTGATKEMDGPESPPYRWTLPGAAKVPFASMSANPAIIMKGLCTAITWITADATTASIDQGIGTVAVNGSRTVCPTVSTKYTLTATGPGGSATAIADVAVISPPPSCNAPTGMTIKP